MRRVRSRIRTGTWRQEADPFRDNGRGELRRVIDGSDVGPVGASYVILTPGGTSSSAFAPTFGLKPGKLDVDPFRADEQMQKSTGGG